ncbi:hypothetical protein D9V37_00595 [Nocardioides mangrovicus]|uniref:YCII-related domain-containing protein n=1 Tax=Nocardioides mangrovicus TaxID=2478913 RepID=A0A3L8P566_9ACTN|nr:YciI family protein [Nocardioides mangrovicus]RLV50526.1 hypothetical protein D9V37_00595 [Nocardioides mangrovicus]
MSQYLILIYETEADYAAATPETFGQVSQAHTEFMEKHQDALVGGNALQPTQTATTVVAGAVTDGPFAETKEALGGYYLIEAPDLDAALAIAKECPARFGGVELRPVMVFD